MQGRVSVMARPAVVEKPSGLPVAVSAVITTCIAARSPRAEHRQKTQSHVEEDAGAPISTRKVKRRVVDGCLAKAFAPWTGPIRFADCAGRAMAAEEAVRRKWNLFRTSDGSNQPFSRSLLDFGPRLIAAGALQGRSRSGFGAIFPANGRWIWRVRYSRPPGDFWRSLRPEIRFNYLARLRPPASVSPWGRSGLRKRRAGRLLVAQRAEASASAI